MTESDLVTAQAAYVYPRLALVADHLGDTAFAAQLRAAGARDLATVKSQYVPGGWFARGYSGLRQFGAGSMFSEPQPWALLAGAAGAPPAAPVLHNYPPHPLGIGGPRRPTKIGAPPPPGPACPRGPGTTATPADRSTEGP